MTKGFEQANVSDGCLFPSIEVATVLSDFKKQTGGIDIEFSNSTNFDIDLDKLSRFISIDLKI